MRVLDEALAHPVRADRVGLSVFQRDGGFLVTESRDGSATVVATLGLFDSREAALERAAARGQELLRQGYRKIAAER